MKTEEVRKKIENALDKLYDIDIFLIENSLNEMCIAHRFAVYLEQENFNDYFVDCEYDKAHYGDETRPKMVSSENGNRIDIVITKRAGGGVGDLACFEVKKCNNLEDRAIDEGKLKILTGQGISAGNSKFNYDYGFFIVFARERKKVEIKLFINPRINQSHE